MRYRRKKFTFAISFPDEFLSIQDGVLMHTTGVDTYRRVVVDLAERDHIVASLHAVNTGRQLPFVKSQTVLVAKCRR